MSATSTGKQMSIRDAAVSPPRHIATCKRMFSGLLLEVVCALDTPVVREGHRLRLFLRSEISAAQLDIALQWLLCYNLVLVRKDTHV